MQSLDTQAIFKRNNLGFCGFDSRRFVVDSRQSQLIVFSVIQLFGIPVPSRDLAFLVRKKAFSFIVLYLNEASEAIERFRRLCPVPSAKFFQTPDPRLRRVAAWWNFTPAAGTRPAVPLTWDLAYVRSAAASGRSSSEKPALQQVSWWWNRSQWNSKEFRVSLRASRPLVIVMETVWQRRMKPCASDLGRRYHATSTAHPASHQYLNQD